MKAPTEPSPPFELPALVEHMLANDRYALLLRPQIVQDLAPRQAARAAAALDAGMSLVPAGELLNSPGGGNVEIKSGRRNSVSQRPRRVWIDAIYIDRFAVSNRQFHQFVVSGGYAEHSLWDPEIWQMLSGFVDASGAPGPRFWKAGKYEPLRLGKSSRHRRELVRGRGLCPLGREAAPQRRRVDQSRRLAGDSA